MIIRNFSDLATSGRRRKCLEILEAGLAAADPAGILPRYVKRTHIDAGGRRIDLPGYSGVYTVAFGKAADSMTRAVNAAAPVRAGVIVMPRGSRSLILGRKFKIFNAGHPRPDGTSVRAARETVKFLRNRRHGDLVVFLVSGGASALLAMPDGVALDDKIRVTDLLLRSGATIREFNCVRKHLSGIKGGRLVAGLKCHAVALVMSDVEGDDVSTIASGTTSMDPTTFQDAVDVIRKYGLQRRIPPEAWGVLEDGLCGRRPETPKEGSVPHHVVAGNGTCLDAMRRKAGELGYEADTIRVSGDIKDAVREVAGRIPQEEGRCLLFGGETTVRVLGRGMGGRNHEMVLRLLKNSQRCKRVAIASIGTDGIDGNTPFAGAITENVRTDPEAIKGFLRDSDSGRFFQKQNANISTGPTHTNLMDIGVVLR